MRLDKGAHKYTVKGKDYFGHGIAVGAILVCMLFVYGIVLNVQSYFQEPKCFICVSEADIGKTIKVLKGSKITLELNEEVYPKENVSIIALPEDLFTITDAKPTKKGTWAIILKAQRTGMAEINVPSLSNTLSDMHVTVVVE